MSKLSWVTDFRGMIQRQDVDMIPTNTSPLLVNISLDKPGTWSKRKGMDLLYRLESGSVDGMIEYMQNDGSRALHGVRDGDLMIYNFSTDRWTGLDTGQFTSGENIQGVNYRTSESRVYWVSESDNLCYETEGTCTDVGSGGDEIRGNSLAVSQETLFIGGITYASGSSVDWQDRVYYSYFDVTNNRPDDQFWSPGEGSLADSTRYLNLQGPCRGLYNYSNIDGVIMFTPDQMKLFDIRFPENDIGVQDLQSIGCANPRAITETNGWLIWMDDDGRIWQWGGGGSLREVSWAIRDDENQDTLLAGMDRSNLDGVCAGTVGSKFYFSIGDITWRGETFENVVIKGLMSQDGSEVFLSIDTYPFKPSIFAQAFNADSDKKLFWGSSENSNVYETGVGLNDDGVAIDSYARTRFEDFGEPFMNKNFEELLVKYRPQETDDTYFKIRYAIDGEWSWNDLSTPDDAGGVDRYGIIDMYESGTILTGIKRVQLPQQARGTNLSIEIGNDQLDEDFEVSALGYVFDTENLDKRVQYE